MFYGYVNDLGEFAQMDVGLIQKTKFVCSTLELVLNVCSMVMRMNLEVWRINLTLMLN